MRENLWNVYLYCYECKNGKRKNNDKMTRLNFIQVWKCLSLVSHWHTAWLSGLHNDIRIPLRAIGQRTAAIFASAWQRKSAETSAR